MAINNSASTVDLVLLGMILEKPSSAYDIQKQVQFRNLSHWVKMSIPSVYKKVFKLEEQGYLSGVPAQDGKIEKTVYSITPSGREYFRVLMAEIASGPAQVLFNFNAVISNLNKIPKDEAATLLAKIESGIEETKSFISHMQPQRGNIPLVGRTIIRQQIEVLNALHNWISEFTIEFMHEE